MGLRFRKSVKIAPGVKLNFSNKSVGISAGTKGARVSVNSNGRVTKSIGIPGTGISYTETSKLGTKSSATKSTKNNTSYFADQSNEPSSFRHQNNTSFRPPDNTDKLKKILRILLYILIPLIAISIDEDFFFPAILLVSIYHMVRIRKAVPAPNHKRLSTVITGFFIALSAFGSVPTDTQSIESISLSSEKTTIDISQTQPLDIVVLPENANSSLLFVIEDESIVEIEHDGSNAYSLHPLAEGTTEIMITSGEIQSNSITVTITDQARIEAEKKAEEERIAAEKKAEEERIAAEKKAEEERIAAEKKAEDERISAEKAASSLPVDSGPIVYVTPTGKRYHYDNSCNGGSYYASTLNKAASMGLTPCKKCVY